MSVPTPAGRAASGGGSGAGGAGRALLVVRGDVDEVRARIAALVAERGWRVTDAPGEELLLERGSRGRTIVLGSLAGRAFYLSARIGTRAGEGGTLVEHRWGAGAGLVLGGTLGRARAARAHAELSQELEAALREQGLLVRVRREG